MKNKWIYVAAVVFGLLTSYFLYAFLRDMQENASDAQTETVVIVSRNVPAKTLLTREILALKKVPLGSSHVSAIREMDEAIGGIAKVPLIQGEPVLKGKIAHKDDFKNGLAYIIPPGRRAMSIPVDDISGVAGLLQPGDRVDVVSVMSASNGQGEESVYSVLILQDIELLAVGKHLDPKGSDAKSGNEQQTDKTVTLAVTVEEAQSLFLANQQGTIRLLLRSPVDDGTVSVPPLQQEKLFETP